MPAFQQEEASRFGFESTASDVAAGVDLAGRVAVVTGGSGGLGAESARVLASRGARVLIGARDVAKGEKVAEEIRAATGNGAVEVGALELGSLPGIRAFSAATLRAGAPSRVVCISSSGHRFGAVDFEDPNYQSRPYDKWEAYGQAKTANIWHALELDRRLQGDGVRAFALHPGAIITELGRHLTTQDREELMARAPVGGFRWKSVEQGAATQVWAATAPELAGRGALYLEDCHVAGPSEDVTSPVGYAPWALDAERAARLWSLSEQLVGATFS